MNKAMLLAPVACIIFMTGCVADKENMTITKNGENPEKEIVQAENKPEADTKKSDGVEKETPKEIAVNPIDSMKKIKVDMTKEEVVDLMGTSYKEEKFLFEGEAGWRLETPVERIKMDYSVNQPTEKEYEDMVGVEQIHTKESGHVVVVRLTDKELVEQVYGYYLNEKDNKVYEYYLFPTGQVKDHIIYPYVTE